MRLRSRMWNQRVRIFRPNPTRTGLGSTSTFALVHTPAGSNAREDMTVQATTHDAGGERQATNRRWFLSPQFRPKMGDVLDIIGGPAAPARLRARTVVAAAGRSSSVHHYEVVTEEWTGVLP